MMPLLDTSVSVYSLAWMVVEISSYRDTGEDRYRK